MRLEAMKHQGRKLDLVPDDELSIEYSKKTLGQVVPNYDKATWADAALGHEFGMNRKQIQRFIRLTYLIEPLQEMVDGRHESEIRIAFNPAVELSFLTESEQYDLADAIVDNQRTPSLAQCQPLPGKVIFRKIQYPPIPVMLIRLIQKLYSRKSGKQKNTTASCFSRWELPSVTMMQKY